MGTFSETLISFVRVVCRGLVTYSRLHLTPPNSELSFKLEILGRSQKSDHGTSTSDSIGQSSLSDLNATLNAVGE